MLGFENLPSWRAYAGIQRQPPPGTRAERRMAARTSAIHAEITAGPDGRTDLGRPTASGNLGRAIRVERRSRAR